MFERKGIRWEIAQRSTGSSEGIVQFPKFILLPSGFPGRCRRCQNQVWAQVITDPMYFHPLEKPTVVLGSSHPPQSPHFILISVSQGSGNTLDVWQTILDVNEHSTGKMAQVWGAPSPTTINKKDQGTEANRGEGNRGKEQKQGKGEITVVSVFFLLVQ